jgi:hypothetical protein
MEFLDQLNNYCLLKEGLVPWSLLAVDTSLEDWTVRTGMKAILQRTRDLVIMGMLCFHINFYEA